MHPRAQLKPGVVHLREWPAGMKRKIAPYLRQWATNGNVPALVLAILCRVTLSSASLKAEEALRIRGEFWQTDGSVRAILVTNDVAYIGGQFSYIGPGTGGGGRLLLSSGSDIGAPFP